MTDLSKPIKNTAYAKPAWLANNDRIHIKGLPLHSIRAIEANWVSMTEFHIESDHWAYPVIQADLTPWPGGINPPVGWKGGLVMFRNGTTYGQTDTTPGDFNWRHINDGGDIIGYKHIADRKNEPPLISEVSESSDWYNGLHIRTLEVCLDMIDLKKLLPPPPVDPIREKAEALYKVAYPDDINAPPPRALEAFKRLAAHIMGLTDATD